MDCEIESCENCATNCGNKSSAVRLLSDDGQALRELRRIGSLRDRHVRSDHSPLRSAIPGYGMEQIVGDILSCGKKDSKFVYSYPELEDIKQPKIYL